MEPSAHSVRPLATNPGCDPLATNCYPTGLISHDLSRPDVVLARRFRTSRSAHVDADNHGRQWNPSILPDRSGGAGFRLFVLQGWQDLNPRPTVLETAALPTELHPCLGGCYFTTGPDKYQEMGTALRP